MLVRKIINVAAPLTEEELERLKLLRNMKDEDITYDEDCPPMTEEQLDELDYLIRKYKTRRITKEIKMKEFPERFQKREVAG